MVSGGVVPPRKAASDNALDDEMICRSCYAHPYPKVEFPLRSQVEVNGRKELLFLIFQGIEPVQRSIGRVILQSSADSFGEVKARFCVRRKFNAPVDVFTM